MSLGQIDEIVSQEEYDDEVDEATPHSKAKYAGGLIRMKSFKSDKSRRS